jgi:hypothetical protein
VASAAAAAAAAILMLFMTTAAVLTMFSMTASAILIVVSALMTLAVMMITRSDGRISSGFKWAAQSARREFWYLEDSESLRYFSFISSSVNYFVLSL